jgi:Ca-activated chloride channel family protein
MTFLWPAMLLLLLLVPLVLVGFLFFERRRSRYAVHFTNVELLAAVATRTSAWRRYVPVALFLVALAAASVALARPQVTTQVPREDASVVLTLDTSGSMLAEDVKPTRLGAAQEAVRRFLKKLPEKFRVGMVAFSSEAQVVAPLTQDREVVGDSLDLLFPGAGTAIGDGLKASVELARSATQPDVPDSSGDKPPATPPKDKSGRPITAIIFLSDGFQTRGTLQPLEGAQLAKAAGIPVYTVALGTAEGVVRFGQGPYSREVPVPPDPETLRQIARATGGEFFEVTTGEGLNHVYERLGSKLGHTEKPREVTYAFLGLSALLLIGAAGLSALWSQRLP